MLNKAGGIEQENPFMPTKSVNLSPDLAVWQDIRMAYAQFPTAESLERVRALNLVTAELAKEGLVADLLIRGSLALGQSTNHSDMDVFGIVTPEERVPIRTITELYQVRVFRAIGEWIDFPVTSGMMLFAVRDLSDYVDSNNFINAISTPLAETGSASFKLREFHVRHQMNLGIGSCRMDFAQRMETLKSDAKVVRALHSPWALEGYAWSFRKSFQAYGWRLSKDPDFSSLPESEKEQFIEHLEERQRQFLFYIENPQYCRID